VPIREHELVKLETRRECISYKGLRYGDRPKKRTALAQIAANQGRESSRSRTIYGCKQCDVHLYKEKGCFSVFHQEK
jgi:hypothetical protein